MKKTLTILLMAVAPLMTAAITLEQAREKAYEHYPLLRDYALIKLTEQYTVENAAKAWLPQVTAGAQTTWQSAVASYPQALTQMLENQGVRIQGLGKFQYKASVDVTQTIWDGGRIKAQQDIAQARARESQASDDIELYQLRSRIDNLYFGILLLEQQHKTLTNTTELLKSNLELMNTLVRHGAAMPSDADAIEAELLTTQQQMLSVESTITMYRNVLGLYLGTDVTLDLEVPQTIMVHMDNDFAERPEIKLFDARLSLLDASIGQVKASLRPTVAAFAQGYFGYPGMNFMEAMMNRNPGFNAMLGVTASWNIGSLYTKKNKLADIEANKQRIDIARKTFEFNTSVQASQQRNEVMRLQQLFESDNEIVSLRQRVRRAAESRLHEGVVEPIVLLQRITEEKVAMISANTHQIEYLKALYSLQTIMNQ